MVPAFIVIIPIGLIRALLRPVFEGLFRLFAAVFGLAAGTAINKAVGPGGTCPKCGFEVGAMASSCAKCGYSPSLAQAALAMPDRSVSYARPQNGDPGSILPMGQCPNCEEIIPMSSKSCPVCRYTPDRQSPTPA